MTNLTKRQAPDRSKINVHEPGEAKRWARELGVSRERLRKLVEKAGNSAAAVRKELEMPKENDLEGAQDQGGKHGGQAGLPKPAPRPARTEQDKETARVSGQKREK
jgi:hypothetical protein